jgi:uncharacterized membrane protein YcaP (DUF421 family)
MGELFHDWLRPGQDGFALDVPRMMLRAVVVFGVALVIVRVGNKRFMGRNTAFDLILAIMLGSVLSRAVTGQSPFFPTLAAGAVLMAMHGVLSWLAYHYDWFGPLVKGRARLLVKDGELVQDGMRGGLMGRNDLMEALRSQASTTSLEGVKLAYLERSGEISVICKDRPPQVLEVKVEEGVQWVRIRLE